MTASNPNPTSGSIKERQTLRCLDALQNEELKLTDWEDSFLRSCMSQMARLDRELTEKQLDILEKIEGYIQNGRSKRTKE